MLFFIPVIVILGVLLFSLGGGVIKSLGIDLALPDLSQYITPQFGSSQEQQASAPNQKPQTLQQTKLSSRPPPAPQTQQSQPPATQNSPWLDKITISSFSKPAGVERFRATLSVNLGDSTPLSITGWRLKSKFSGETTLGLGMERYHPVLNNQPIENIVVQRYDTVYLSGEPSPLGRGMNFRTNACFGYLKPYYPSLPGTSSCSQDRPRVEEISNLNPVCQEFILNEINFSSCKIPDLGLMATNTECVAYINSSTNGFNYTGCYEKRKNESGFLPREWYIYSDTQLGHSLHDTITLYDQNGLVVDTYIY